MVASVVAIWPAFSGATGEDGSVAFGLYIGAVSIVLMAWSFLLALRPRVLEPVFGGLDAMYRAHRWAGSLAVVAMFLHTRAEPEIEGGVRGASRSVAEQAEGLAGTGELMLYGLVAISLIRWFPYRYWRLTHKLLGIPFAFACWHFFTAEKPYANGSGWGIYFAAVMLVGLGSYVVRVIGRDMLARGTRYRVVRTARLGSTIELELEPCRAARLEHRAGQFAVVKLQRRGLSEPHVFTIASSPEEPNLRFFIRELGDWTVRIGRTDLVGTDVLVEGPYGEFQPLPDTGQRAVWIAGGVGITPFLAVTPTLPRAEPGQRPTLIYCVRDRADATGSEVLEAAAADGRIDLEWFESGRGRRFDAETFATVVGDDLSGAHVAVCGPSTLVASAVAASRARGSGHVETEDFDLRSGVGPDLSLTLHQLGSRSDRGDGAHHPDAQHQPSQV